jgi:DNA-binding MarR family transcriptional regulator
MEKYNIDRSLGLLLAKVSSKMRAELVRNMQNLGLVKPKETKSNYALNITSEQRYILLRLSKQNGLTQKELSEKTFFDPSSTTLILDKLENKKLVQRVKCKVDRRAFKVYLTDFAKPIIPLLENAGLSTNKKATQGLSNDEIALFRLVCEKIYENLNKVD